ncbi:transmembrane protein 53-A-like [Branchiostoma floridae]|uniref:Transmembrane protein 53-A-like n=3 Tax=Branchiostoma floridae TaxID=7739 RepID=A0A9J7MEZ8_BRAFL|nr:transmembrane protein 53-A-like [Branchiostoma floridae]
MADEDLEYDISFPPAAVSDDEKEPVVILLGWAGCKENHLAKYSSIHEQQGCITIRYIMPTYDIFFHTYKARTVAYKILELIFDLNLEGHPIFFHVFSNGGGFIYRYLTEMVASQRGGQVGALQIVGCIFDSCPSRRSLIVGMKALLTSMHHEPFLKRYSVTFFFGIMVLFNTLRSWLSWLLPFGFLRGEDDYYTAMKKDPSRWPQLFLYSRADKVVPYRQVEDVFEARKKLGVRVLAVAFENSPHVTHLVHHRDLYMHHCNSFVKSCTMTGYIR